MKSIIIITTFFMIIFSNSLLAQDQKKWQVGIGGVMSNPEKIIGYDFDMKGWGLSGYAFYEIYKDWVYLGIQADYIKNKYGLTIDTSLKYSRTDYTDFVPINAALKINHDFGIISIYVEAFEGFVLAHNKTDFRYYGNKFAADNGTKSNFQDYGIGAGACLKLDEIFELNNFKNLDFFIEVRRAIGRDLKAYDAVFDNNFHIVYTLKQTSYVLNLLSTGLNYRF